MLVKNGLIYFGLKGELGEIRIYLRKIPLHQQNFWCFRLFLIRLACREISKNVQNAMTGIRPMVKSRSNMKKG